MSRTAPGAGLATLTWRPILAGTCALFVGVGLSRFGYTPIMPVLISANWFTESEAGHLGAANLVGYLIGAIASARIARRLGGRLALRASLVLAGITFFACASPLSFFWYLTWRFVSGATGGVIMVLAVTLALSRVSPRHRGIAGGAVLAGVGFGILTASLVVPALLRFGLAVTWAVLGGASGLAVAASWRGWPEDSSAMDPAISPGARPAGAGTWRLGVLSLVYGMTAIGLVPHFIFFSDFVARGLGQGIALGSAYAALFGLGALSGPILFGRIGELIGFRLALHLAIAMETVGVGVLLFSGSALSVTFSALVVGGLTTGAVPVIVGRIHELVDHDVTRQRHHWSRATTAFAIAQAAGGWLHSNLFAIGGSYAMLFAVAAGILSMALVIDIAIGAIPASALNRLGPPSATGSAHGQERSAADDVA